MFVADYHTLQQLQDLAQAIPQKRLWRRVQAVLLALSTTEGTSPRSMSEPAAGARPDWTRRSTHA